MEHTLLIDLLVVSDLVRILVVVVVVLNLPIVNLLPISTAHVINLAAQSSPIFIFIKFNLPLHHICFL